MSKSDRILFINPIKIRPVVGPIGLDYIGHRLQQSGFKIDIIDNSFSSNIEDSIKDYIVKNSPLAIGVTVRNTDDCYFQSQRFFIDDIRDLIAYVKSITKIPIIAGGVGFSIVPKAVMEYCNLDFGIQGDGEEAILLFLKAIQGEKDFSSIPNLIYRKNGKLIENKRKLIDLNSLGAQSRKIINNELYFTEGGQGNIETKRGCNQKCIYCADPICKGSKIRLKDPELVCNELKTLMKQNVNVFHICDSEFNIHLSHAKQVCEAIIDRGLNKKIKWYAYCTPKPFNEELGKLMREAGCIGIDFGVDSGDNEILKNLKRDFQVNDVLKTAEVCKSLGFVFMFDLLIGGPGETKESVSKTIELMKEIRPNRVGLSIGIRIYAGTELAKIILEGGPLNKNSCLFGFKENNDNLLKPIFYLNTDLEGKKIFSYIGEIVGKDQMFFFANPEERDQNYNYNENLVLVKAIKNGYRGAYWNILRQLSEKGVRFKN
ncbi:MAG: B12-binding domain-containing radical SAM protein [Candidatus Helarchaeota archaeon]